MSRRFRVIDTGVRDGRLNIAFDQALIDLRQMDVIGDTIRFLQFQPSALIGRHQSLSREVHLHYCHAHEIKIARRITGGGALFMDEGQLGFELIFKRQTLGVASLADLARVICETVAEGIGSLGVNAQYRPRNDIEVDGRKISGTGGFFDGDTIFYQGTLLIDLDVEKMLAVLKVPKEKLEKRGLDSASSRIVTLEELLAPCVPDLASIKGALLRSFGGRLGIEPICEMVSHTEEEMAQRLCAEKIGTDEFVAEIDDPGDGHDILSGSVTGPGGTVRALLRLERKRIREALITGDFFVTPPRTIVDLEASLRGVATEEIEHHVRAFFAAADVGLLSVAPGDFAAAISAAVSSGKKSAAL
jgi:lipoate-protein ligase A